MNSQKIYELSMNALRATLARDGASDVDTLIDSILKSKKIQNFLPPVSELAQLVLMSRDEIAKQKIGTNMLKGMKNIIKSAVSSGNMSINGYWIEDGKQVVCDGFRAVISDTICEELQKCDSPNPPNVHKIIESSRGNQRETLQLPSIQELKMFIADEKARGKKLANGEIRYDFGENKPLVNAGFLMDMLMIFGEDCVATNNGNYNIIFEADGLVGILLGIHKNR